jgi:hypothetical protein
MISFYLVPLNPCFHLIFYPLAVISEIKSENTVGKFRNKKVKIGRKLRDQKLKYRKNI